MKPEERMNRREALRVGTGLVLGASGVAEAAERGANHIDPEKGVTAPEDLMKEHGVLNRCLLIYEAGMRRLRTGEDITPEVFQHTAQLVRRFVEEYHEKNEEKYIFPQFRKAGKLTDLVSTLLRQHRAGRVVTADILRLSQPAAFRDAANRKHLIASCESFIRMYRPHESREDTILFPALRTILTAKQVESLGDRMEGDEEKVLGHEGFEKSVSQVAAIEKQLGIYDLNQFTPKVSLSLPPK
jgi:hemerythrin-like domain-containing protein